MKPCLAQVLRTLMACAAALSTTAPLAADRDAPSRDPMQPPAVTTPAPTASAAARQAPHPDAAVIPRHLMVIDGRRWVIERGQRLGVGDRLGDARIERIGDGVVWLRDARGLREMSFYRGVTKRTVAERDAAARPPVGATEPAPIGRSRPAARRRIAAAVAPIPSEPRTP
jgi:hypothetical protein